MIFIMMMIVFDRIPHKTKKIFLCLDINYFVVNLLFTVANILIIFSTLKH